MHLHLVCLNYRSKVAQLLLGYRLCLKECIQFVVSLLDLVKILLLLHGVHCGQKFFIQHLDLYAHLLQDLVSSSDDADPVANFPENFGAFRCVLVQCYSGVVSLQYYILHLLLQLLRLLLCFLLDLL